MKEQLLESVITLPKFSSRNTNKVCKSTWARWSPEARAMFNHLYSVGSNNQEILSGTDVLDIKASSLPCVHKVLDTTIWNMAWEAAEFVNERNPAL